MNDNASGLRTGFGAMKVIIPRAILSFFDFSGPAAQQIQQQKAVFVSSAITLLRYQVSGTGAWKP
jgi:hypothetical protein